MFCPLSKITFFPESNFIQFNSYQVPALFHAEEDTPFVSVLSSLAAFPSILLGVISTPSFSNSYSMIWKAKNAHLSWFTNAVTPFVIVRVKRLSISFVIRSRHSIYWNSYYLSSTMVFPEYSLSLFFCFLSVLKCMKALQHNQIKRIEKYWFWIDELVWYLYYEIYIVL